MSGSTLDLADERASLRIQPRHFHTTLQWRSVPVMQETLLLVELEAYEPCVDLNALSHLILNDLGATLEILRLVGREYDDAEGRPIRMVDCLADMGLQACVDAMSVELIPGGRRSKALKGLSNHCAEIARHSKYLAEQTEGIDPDLAYLVGLCHAIGALPMVLGWNGSNGTNYDGAHAGLTVAREWRLPRCVVDYFSDVERGGLPSSWPKIVQAAHRSAGQPVNECPAREYVQTQLQRAV